MSRVLGQPSSSTSHLEDRSHDASRTSGSSWWRAPSPNLKKINQYVEESLMLVTALSPVIGYDKASKIAHYANDNDLTLKAAALKLGFVTEAEFDSVVDPKKMVRPYVATPVAA
jgi:fumarate hydratase class II